MEIVMLLILKASMKMAGKSMKKMVMKKPLRATKKKNNGQMTSVTSLLMNFQHNWELL